MRGSCPVNAAATVSAKAILMTLSSPIYFLLGEFQAWIGGAVNDITNGRMVPSAAVSGLNGLRIQLIGDCADPKIRFAKSEDTANDFDLLWMRHEAAVEVRKSIWCIPTVTCATAKLRLRFRRSAMGTETNSTSNECLPYGGFRCVSLLSNLLQTDPRTIQISGFFK